MLKKELGSIKNVLDNSTIVSIIIISLIASLLSLTIPIAAQTLINLIAFGKLIRPVLTLSFIVFIFMTALGAMNVWQLIIVEIIQQKLMVNVSLNLTSQYNHLSLTNFSAHHGPELVNRFFEISLMKKSLANLLIYGINLTLQVIFGLILLLIYHPLFLLFDAFVIVGILLVVFIPYRKAVASAEQECIEKHKIGAWLEEILINRFLFRFNHYDKFVYRQTDKRLVNFLKARNTHFRQLLKHQIGFNLLAAFASSLLLGVGGYLVVNDQLSLGQLAAAEIVLGALTYSFKRFGSLLENYYDMIASEGKIETVLNLPTENTNKGPSDIHYPIECVEIKTKTNNMVLATPNKPLLVISEDPDKCQQFTRAIFGFVDENAYKFYFNHTISTAVNRVAIRQLSMLIAQPEWFAGTIYDNLVLGQKNVANKQIMDELKRFSLLEKIMQQPDGLKTMVYEWKTLFSYYEIIKFMCVRAILLEPQLLVIDRTLDGFNDEKLNLILPHLINLKDTTLIVVTHKAEFQNITNQLVLPS